MADLIALAPVQMVDMWQVGTPMVGVPGPRGEPGRQPASLVADPTHPGLYLPTVGTSMTSDPAHPGLYMIGV